MEKLTLSTQGADGFERSFYVETLRSLEDWPSHWQVPSRHFVFFLAADTSTVSDDALAAFARQVLNQGAVYVCAWGPDSQRVENVFDLARSDEETDETTVITTSHAAESLQDALFYFTSCAFPATAFERTCSTWVAAVLGNEQWAAAIRRYLSETHGKTKE
jgi:hypothetical protein